MQNIQSEERFQDFVAEFDQCVFDIMMVSETWRAENEEVYVTPAGGRIFLIGNGHHQNVGRKGCGRIRADRGNVETIAGCLPSKVIKLV